jgi:hypothetical protein
MTDEALLEQLESWFSDATDWDDTWRDNAKTWYDYYHGTQWTSDEEAALIERGQAVTTYNHIAPAIDAIIGGERQNRPEVKMVGRSGGDEQLAQVKTELYGYIEDNSNTNDELDRMVQDALVTGRGWLFVYPAINGKDFEDIKHMYIDYRDMFIDNYSKNDSLSDARYITQAVYTDADIIKSTFPKFKEDLISETSLGFDSSSDDEIYYDNKDRSRPRLMNTWFRDENGDVTTAVWVKGQLLYKKKDPYTLKDFPYVCYTVKRDMENMPYGLVKSMVSPQDEVNKRHSKALHYLNAKQVLAEEGAFEDWNEAKKTLARPDGITKLTDRALAEGKVQIIDNTQLATSHIQMMEHAKGQVMALAGINAAYVGQGGQYESAKKSQVAIAGAQNVLVPMLNKLRIARHRLAKITMNLVPDFYGEERLIRILQPTGEYAFMPINSPQLLDNGMVGRLNDISNDDVDVIIEDAPSGLNDRIEQFNQLLGIQGQTGRPIPMEILLRYSNLKDKHQLASELEQHYAIEAQLQQAQQYAQQLEQQVQKLGGHVNQVESQLVQANVARAVDKEVGKAKQEIEKEKNQIKGII